MKKTFFILVTLSICAYNPVGAQFLKKLKEKVEKNTEKAVEVGKAIEIISKTANKTNSKAKQNNNTEEINSSQANKTDIKPNQNKNNTTEANEEINSSQANKTDIKPKKNNTTEEITSSSDKKNDNNQSKKSGGSLASTPGTHSTIAKQSSSSRKPVPVVKISYSAPKPSDSLFVIGTKLWHAGKNVALEDGLAVNSPVAYVKGAPGYFFSGPYPKNDFGFVRNVGGYSKKGDPSFGNSPRIGNSSKDEEMLLSKDLRRAIFIKDGDLWRAEYDWSKGEYINKKQVTSIGLLKGKRPLYWYKNAVYIEGGFSAAKPIVRVDLMTGDTKEIGRNGVFDFNNRYSDRGSVFSNPSGSILCRADDEILYCYNAETQTFFRIANEYKNTSLIYPLGLQEPVVWLNDNTFATVSANGIVSRFDLANNRTDILLQIEKISKDLGVKAVLPGNRWIEVGIAPHHYVNEVVNEQLHRFLLDLTNGATTTLELPNDADGKWLDANTYLYSKEDGGLSQIGTWIFDRSSNETRKFSSSITRPNEAVSFPKLKVVYFFSYTGKPAIYRADLSNGKTIKVMETEDKQPYPVLTPPIDLGVGKSSGPAWSASLSVTPTSKGDNNKKTRSSNPSTSQGGSSSAASSNLSLSPTKANATGMELILQATKDLPYKYQEEVKQAYDHSKQNFMLSRLYDPACIALKFWEIRRQVVDKEPYQTTWIHFLAHDSMYASCVSRSNIINYIKARTAQVEESSSYSEEQKEEIETCVSSSLADEFVANPTTNPGLVDERFTKAVIQCEKNIVNN